MVTIVKKKSKKLPELKLPPKSRRKKKVPWSFSSKVSSSPRKDGKGQSKITIAKRFINHVENQSGNVEGTFSVETIEDGMQIYFDKEKLPDTPTLNTLYTARWIPLTCPICGAPAPPPLFMDARASVSEILIHECGAEYFCDLEHSDLSWGEDPQEPQEDPQWRGIIIHNYSVLTSLVGFSLSNDFDMMNPSSMLKHVIFRVKKDQTIGRLGYTSTDNHGDDVAVLFTRLV
jgi:hypothetical protein